nr:MAG TPA: hypothetical protein [Caudoviricetes sp.]
MKKPLIKRSVSYCQFVFSELHIVILILIMRIVNRKILFLRIFFFTGEELL